MKDSQEYILFKTVGLRYSPWMEDMENALPSRMGVGNPNKLQEGTHRSFAIEFNNNIDRISMLIHFKHLSIQNLTLHYRKKSARNKKNKKITNNVSSDYGCSQSNNWRKSYINRELSSFSI